MKKVLLTMAAMAIGALSLSAQEVTYAEDCSQGLLINKAAENWFVTGEGGVNMTFRNANSMAETKNRICGGGGLYVGKWFTPTLGLRFGAKYMMLKGATHGQSQLWKQNEGELKDAKGYYPAKCQAFGPEVDVMFNLANLFCGYQPERVYNPVFHFGTGIVLTQHRAYGENKSDLAWRKIGPKPLFGNIGLQNNFAVCENVDLFVDFQSEICRLVGEERFTCDLQLAVGATININKKEWHCPVTAVVPVYKYTDAEGDALVARLAQAEAKIADLQKQLDDCLNRPVEKVDCDGIATIYYPINKYALSSRERTILKSLAEVMKETPSQKYILTGWADNYTGTDDYNTRLRQKRVDGVKNYLVKCGVDASQLETTTDQSNLTDFGVKGAPMDRAVTIKLAQ